MFSTSHIFVGYSGSFDHGFHFVDDGSTGETFHRIGDIIRKKHFKWILVIAYARKVVKVAKLPFFNVNVCCACGKNDHSLSKIVLVCLIVALLGGVALADELSIHLYHHQQK